MKRLFIFMGWSLLIGYFLKMVEVPQATVALVPHRTAGMPVGSSRMDSWVPLSYMKGGSNSRVYRRLPQKI